MVHRNSKVGWTVLVGVYILDSCRAEFIAKAWVDHTVRHIGVDSISFDELAYELDNSCVSDPAFAWETILKIVRMYDEGDVLDASGKDNMAKLVLANLAAGPMEDVLNYHGDDMIASIEAEACHDSRIRWLLGQVWRNDISQEVWGRVRRILLIKGYNA